MKPVSSSKRTFLRPWATAASAGLLLTSGLARAQQATFVNIADENTPAPGRSDKFTDTINASISGNTVTFIGTYGARGPGNPVDYGVYTANVGTAGVARVADDTVIPQGGGSTNTLILANPVISGSTVSFIGNNYGSYAASAIYTGTAGVTGATLVADTSTPVPGQSSSFAGFGSSSVSGSRVAFTGSYSGGGGLYLNTAGIARVVDSSTPAPGQAGGFTSFSGAALSGNNLAFTASYNGSATSTNYNQDGVFSCTATGAGLVRVAGTSTPAPGQSNNFTGFSGASLNGTLLVFPASYGTGSGLYAGTAGVAGAARVADTSTLAPGKGTLTFTSFTGFATNGTSVVFGGTYGGAVTSAVGSPQATAGPVRGEGIYLWSGGSLTSVVSDGDALFGSTVRDVGVNSQSYDGNEIAFSYILANGEAGVAVAEIAVPEPGTWLGGALLGLLTLAGGRQSLHRAA